jgi:hypothetical protein
MFWMLFAIEGAILTVVLLFSLYLFLPTHVPAVDTVDYARVREAIWSRLNGDVSDPLIEVAPGVTARSSNLRGFALNGRTYYYYIEGRRGFDPLSRGTVDISAVEIVLQDTGGPQSLVIYRLRER